MKAFVSAASIALALSGAVYALPANGTAIAKRQCPTPSAPASSSVPASSSSASDPTASSGTPPPATGGGGGGGGSGSFTATAVYADDWLSTNNFPTSDTLKGWTALYLAFWTSSVPADNAQNWASIDATTKAGFKKNLNDGGIKLMVSAFGSTVNPTTGGEDPTDVATRLAQWVKDQGLDGVDIDYEDLQAFNNGSGAEDWLITLTKVLRAALPPPYIITHAPLAPWFQPGSKWAGGGYLKVDKEVGSLIDWYNVQFYNQGVTEYTDCAGLFEKSSDAWPQTSVFEMIANGVDPSKILVGKPATMPDASNGYVDPATLAGCVSQNWGKNGWNAGVMSWQFPHATSQWIETVRGSAF